MALDRPAFVQWRSGEGGWRDAMPHEFGQSATCEFLLRIEPGHGYLSGDDLRVCGAVRGFPSGWLLDMPARRWVLTAPENLRVSGTSLCPGPGQILRAAGEFQCSGHGITVMNAGPSQATLLPVDAAPPSVMPWAGAFFVTTGRLSDEEIALLKQETPPCQD
jgi:hypothetical protein